MAIKFGTFQKTPMGLGLGGNGGATRITSQASLNLTPMIDMLTIMLVFLIKSYSVDPAYLTPTQGIQLAQTTSETVAPDKAVLFIGKDGILVEGKLVVTFKEGVIDHRDVKNGILPALQKALDEVTQKTKFIAERNPTVEFTGTLILQADRELPFESMKPILRTAGLAGYQDIKFAGLYPD